MEAFATTTTAGIVILVINGVAMWIREWRRSRSSNSDIKIIKRDICEIKNKLSALSESNRKNAERTAAMGEAIKAQQRHCTETVRRIMSNISDLNRELLTQARRKGSK